MPLQNDYSTFAWQGTNTQGQLVSGNMTGANPAMVKALLRRQGIQSVTIQKPSTTLFRFRQPKITHKTIAVFTRQLATMLNAGIPIAQAFDIVANSCDNVVMHNLVLTLKKSITDGMSLFESFSQHPTYFNDLFCHLVQAGEQGGVLISLLDKIATYQEKTISLKAKIQKAMYYPLAVILVAFVVTALIMAFVVPQFQSLFSSFGADLPVFTELIINLSNMIVTYGWLFCLISIGCYLMLIAWWRRSPTLRDRIDRLSFSLPITGKIRHKAVLARFCRTTATLFAAGVPLVEALTAVANATGSTLYSQAVLIIRDQIAAGQSLHHVLQQQPLFPSMVEQMISIGEESGTLDSMLAKTADFYEEEVDNAVNGLTSLLEPFIMVFLGLLIGGLVVALYLPIFQLGSVVSSH